MSKPSSCGPGPSRAALRLNGAQGTAPLPAGRFTLSPSSVSPACQQDADGASPLFTPAQPSLTGCHYRWIINGMDCPSCARKVEKAVSALTGVREVQVLFATQTLLVNADGNIKAEVEQAVKQAGFRLQDKSAPAEKPAGFWQENRLLLAPGLLMLASWLLHFIGPTLGQAAFILTTLAGLWPISRKAWKLTRSGSPFAIETLMTVAAVGALFIGASAEAAMVLLLFLLGERLEGIAANRARRGITALMALKPDKAVRVRNEQREEIAASMLRPGDIIEVAAGERLPADARLLSPFASFDESALTGESIPAEHQQDAVISAGCISIDRQVRLAVISKPGESAIDRILQLIEQAETHRAPLERFLDRFSRIYTPLVILLALLVALLPPLLLAADWQTWIYKGLTLLLIGCPCALVISTPAAITSGLAAAARRGALIKGGAALEKLGGIRLLAFDKTGTLTIGKPELTDMIPLTDIDHTQLLLHAAAVEQGATHPLALAIVAQARRLNQPLPQAQDRRVLPGRGIEAQINGQRWLLSAPLPGLTEALAARINQLESAGKTVVVVYREQQPLGLLALRDTLRDDVRSALAELQQLGVNALMLTGDNPRAAAAIAAEIGLDYRAGLLPADKVAAIRQLSQAQPVAMVGDGINDAPAMKAATLGIAMGSGSDVALETADAALTHNRLSGLAAMIRLSRATRRNIRQNIAIALGLKALLLVTTLLGLTGLWLAVLADSGATALVTANALRLLRQR
ncbi:zinc/cadmium/mercury/lead-transporting ATPase [Mixta theicola]|uniref:P-type Zn(2+) transporter n=1 Tax=Mixta theicola TaxID=1458355 RepID=A0A2K1Q9V8_9GAMM|nr:zinc/cadmium/mercury/lead-transporting ATPase [Mixta theicola]PNS11805.1 zinc/cadmium/mercury/lead-transporting ATPase [Mixta theicola]GLR07724.1 zinc/cadmium/mercury/lead-transporting ATPase [Mixta theicola]